MGVQGRWTERRPERTGAAALTRAVRRVRRGRDRTCVGSAMPGRLPCDVRDVLIFVLYSLVSTAYLRRICDCDLGRGLRTRASRSRVRSLAWTMEAWSLD